MTKRTHGGAVASESPERLPPYPPFIRLDSLGPSHDPTHPEISFTVLRDYIFHESREIHIPEESEILPEPPGFG